MRLQELTTADGVLLIEHERSLFFVEKYPDGGKVHEVERWMVSRRRTADRNGVPFWEDPRITSDHNSIANLNDLARIYAHPHNAHKALAEHLFELSGKHLGISNGGVA